MYAILTYGDYYKIKKTEYSCHHKIVIMYYTLQINDCGLEF